MSQSSVLTKDNLATFLGIDKDRPGLQEAVDAGEDYVRGILGLASINLTTGNTHTVTLDLDRQRIVLPNGPVTSLTSITLDGTADDLSNWQSGYFTQTRTAGIVSRGVTVVFTYVIGWDKEDLPSPLRTAILRAATSIFGRPDANISSAKIGPETTLYEGNWMPSDVLQLASRYAAPTVF